MLDLNELLDEAVKETRNLNEDGIFLVSDLSIGCFLNKTPYNGHLPYSTLKKHLQIKRDT
ncbi:MAG: hypothetical protein WCY62_05120 [Clostridia bacterium]|jgi:hypothetical protein